MAPGTSLSLVPRLPEPEPGQHPPGRRRRTGRSRTNSDVSRLRSSSLRAERQWAERTSSHSAWASLLILLPAVVVLSDNEVWRAGWCLLDDLPVTSCRSPFGKTPGGLEPPCRALQARAYPARPRCQSPREESNLCARGRNPLLFQLSYGGRRERLALPVVVVAHSAVKSGHYCGSTS